MTTTVILHYPKPNHLCARVVTLNRDQHGLWRPQPMPSILGPENQIVQAYVHEGRRLIIDEVAANDADKPLPGGELALAASTINRLWPGIAGQIRSAHQQDVDLRPLNGEQLENLRRFVSVLRSTSP